MSIFRLNLVSSPRNRSTLLMYSFAQRPDTTVFDEPYYAHYLSQTDVTHPGQDEILSSQSTDIKQVHDYLMEESGDIIFIKNMAHHFRTNEFFYLLDFKNILYIRHPQAIVNSYSKVISNPTIEDIGIQKVLDIYDFLVENGKQPLVLDSDDLIAEPEKCLRVLCSQLHIPFEPAMLTWATGPKPYDGVWAKYWYTKVRSSSGFIKPDNNQIPITLDKLHSQLVEECMPAYIELKSKALTYAQE